MTEFLKGYAAGANDMEAGRLVRKDAGVVLGKDEQGPLAKLRDDLKRLENSCTSEASLRELLGVEQTNRVAMEQLLEAAEAKLAEAEKELAELRKGDT